MIELDRDRKNAAVIQLQGYFRDELGQEIGQFEAEFLLDFFIVKIGPQLYNQGLQDAQAALSARIEDIRYAIDELEKPAQS